MAENRPVGTLEELRKLIAELGKDGGRISPSIYDTAQRLRFYPPPEGVAAGIDWLLSQQYGDGGWCDPAVPAARDASTLAAILAIQQYRTDTRAVRAQENGLAFLRRQASQWATIPMDGLPIAVEVILPKLLNEAKGAGLEIDPAPYARLCAIGRKKLDILATMDICYGSAPAYSWEAFGDHATAELLDRVGSVGHSPAATAKWLQLARGQAHLSAAVARAEAYLDAAHRATDTPIAGVLPVVFPIKSFELCYGPYALLLTNLLDTAPLQDDLSPLMRELDTTLTREKGIGFGDGFVADVDDTAVATAVLETVGRRVESSYVMQFLRHDHFFTFAYELNPSVFSNAHAVHALALQGTRVPAVEDFLLARQQANHQWPPDKWHTCWRYTTLEVMTALAETGHKDAVCRALLALMQGQESTGVWSHAGVDSRLDTIYSVVGLALGQRMGLLSRQGQVCLEKGLAWLQSAALERASLGKNEERRWLSKEVYSPRRVDEVFRLVALLMAELSRACAYNLAMA